MSYKDVMNKVADYFKKSDKFSNVNVNPLLEEIVGEGPFILLKENNNQFIFIKDILLDSFRPKGENYYTEFLDKEWLNMNKDNFDFYIEFNSKEQAINNYNQVLNNYHKQKKLVISTGNVGKLIDLGNNSIKVEGEYDTQGVYYKSKEIYELQKTLTKEQFDLLPIDKKICYVAECDDNSIINNQNIQNYIDNGGVSSYFSIRDEVKDYIGKDNLDRFSEDEIVEMCDDVFENIDWQCASSLISEDYLDGYIEEKFKLNEEEEEDEI